MQGLDAQTTFCFHLVSLGYMGTLICMEGGRMGFIWRRAGGDTRIAGRMLWHLFFDFGERKGFETEAAQGRESEDLNPITTASGPESTMKLGCWLWEGLASAQEPLMACPWFAPSCLKLGSGRGEAPLNSLVSNDP